MTIKLTFTRLHPLLVVVSVALCTGCAERKPPPVTLPEPQLLLSYENPSPPFRLKVLMHAPGNFLFYVENLLPGFQLAGLPKVSSPTGRILQARLLSEEQIQFQLLLPGDAYVQSPNDVSIPWTLNEKGPGGFLRREGKILVDITLTPDGGYSVKSVAYEPAADLPPARK